MTADIVLIRGIFRNQAHWLDWPERLAARFPSSQVICVDLPGNGRLNHLASPLNSYSACQSFRIQVRLQQPEPRPLHLVAISMGAMLALDWQRRYPHEIASLTLMNTSVANLSSPHQRLNWTIWWRLLPLLWSGTEASERRILALTSNAQSARERALAGFIDAKRRYPLTGMNMLRQVVLASKLRALHTPHCPCLLVSSEQDRLVSARCSEVLAKFLGASVCRHPWAGHDLPLDAPTWLEQRLEIWLAEVT
ncbi:alpha/beta fold hydrolase [Aliagarivorans taiwanensis]|uniref:alpha/beta fold hydrolase n=1 Tax=Aliagarivorans taiwanensis TaxID=561966 RepID=UPI00040A939C|nr:alpha/beta hydrolase [Aliagarivorans taiwanensis]